MCSRIENFPNYLIFENGSIQNIWGGRTLKQHKDRDGYMNVYLYHEGKKTAFKVHRLLAIAFIPNPDKKLCIDHINNITDDNNLNNLRWCSHSENNMNRSIYKNNNTGVKGVQLRRDKYVAIIIVDKKSKHIGTFDTIEEATEARVNEAIKLFGKFINPCEIIHIN